MNVSNIVISTVSAISMAGVLGIAYAQSTYTEPQPGTSATTSQDPDTMNQAPSGTAAPDAGSTMSQDATGAMPEDSSGSTAPPRTYNERVARADRN